MYTQLLTLNITPLLIQSTWSDGVLIQGNSQGCTFFPNVSHFKWLYMQYPLVLMKDLNRMYFSHKYILLHVSNPKLTFFL